MPEEEIGEDIRQIRKYFRDREKRILSTPLNELSYDELFEYIWLLRKPTGEQLKAWNEEVRKRPQLNFKEVYGMHEKVTS